MCSCMSAEGGSELCSGVECSAVNICSVWNQRVRWDFV